MNSAFVQPQLPILRTNRVQISKESCVPRRLQTSVTRRAVMTVTETSSDPLVLSTERAAKLPWQSTIAEDDSKLLFMPFVEHQLDVMKAQVSGVEDVPFEQSLSYQSSDRRPARIESWLWKSDTFRKIRATYIDAGINAQVFNSVWYPSPEYDLPLLGIDFLSFGKKKVLCVLDFQPLVQDPEYLKKYCEPMAPVKMQYEGLSGSMSSRFYDEAQFFSRQLIFAKFDNSEPVMTQLFPAFKEYLAAYLKMIDQATPDTSPESVARVRQLHVDYDQYSAERDPAVGLFGSYWGKEWAEKFTHEFLFSDAVPVPKEEAEKA